MNRRGAWPIIGIACLLGMSAAATPDGSAHERFVCRSGPSMRVISIYRDTSAGDERAAGCHVDYTREGATRTVWSASTRGYAYCVKKALTLVATLSKDRYACTPDAVGKAGEAESQ